MPFIINIEVTGKTGFVSLAEDGIVLETLTNTNAMEHASFLQPSIKQLLGNHQITAKAIAAIALSNGPGSYTGLRVGLASAKGLSFALNIPLITINTLRVMAFSAGMEIEQNKSIKKLNTYTPGEKGDTFYNEKSNQGSINQPGEFLVCPLIDARRMEVFFGLYTNENEEIIAPSAGILDKDFLDNYLENSAILFTGSGAEKLQKIITHPNANYQTLKPWDQALAHLSYNYFYSKSFTDVNQAEPFYCKDFYDATGRG